ncbi:MAG: class E sortase [Acidimicrobiales bacterium]
MRALNVAGRLLLALGVAVLLFTAYQLWGTGLGEQHSQSVLRSRLARELPPGEAAAARRLSNGAPHRVTRPTASSPALAPTVAAPAPGQPIGTIDIPNIGLDQVVVEGVAAADLRMGPGHYPGTPLPGQAGNTAVAGHRTTYAHPFYSLDAVVPGDQIILTTPQGVFDYTAVRQQIVAPTDVAVIADTTTPTLTLTTCNPRYSAATRLVVHADLTRSQLFTGSHPLSAGAAPKGNHAARAGGANRARGTHPAAIGGSGLAGTGDGGSIAAAAGWGAGVLAVVTATLLLARRPASRRRRWALQSVGALACLPVLFFFFGAVSPLLPASF